MKIKRTYASTMSEALKKVREEQGPDAVILSNRKVENGVEVISAIDYDEKEVLAAADSAASGRSTKGMSVSRMKGRSGADTLGAKLSKSAAAFTDVGRKSFSQASRSEPANPSNSSLPKSLFDKEIEDDVVSLSSMGARPGAAPWSSDASSFRPKAADSLRNEEAAGGRSPKKRVEWSEDPAISGLRDEIRSLRGLFEDQLAVLEWGGMTRKNPNRATLLKRYYAMGLSRKVSEMLADAVSDSKMTLEQSWQASLSYLEEGLSVTDDDILDNGGIVAVVGPTGVGKTTTVAKLAARYTLRHGKGQVALITTDSFRIGAHDQLRSFGKILGVPVYVAADREELETVVESLRGVPLVLIDTAGMSQRDISLAEQLETLSIDTLKIKTYLVLSANTQLQSMKEAVRAFRQTTLNGTILTKVDESASLGNALSVMLQYRLPVAYVGTGQRVPEDILPARADFLVEQAVTLSEPEDEDEEKFAVAFARPVTARC